MYDQKEYQNIKIHINESLNIKDIIELKNFPISSFSKYRIDFDINKPIMSQIPQPEKDWGEIYINTNIVNGKIYIGQAQNYISANIPHRSTGRWKSHKNKSKNATNDDCPIFNGAIRKYGYDNFRVRTLISCHVSELDYWEKFFIQLFNSLVDNKNGYNYDHGGKKNRKFCKAFGQKISLAKTGKKLSESIVNNIRLGNMGKKLSKQKRKYPEDELLDTYISGNRENGILIGYNVYYPIGITEQKKVYNGFIDRENPQNALEAAKEQLAQWEIEYKDRPDIIAKNKKERYEIETQLNTEKKHKKKLPEYIFPNTINNKLKGYYVKNFPDNDGNPYPDLAFTKCTSNFDNLNGAKRYIQLLEIKNKDGLFKEYIPKKIAEWAQAENEKDPQTMKRMPKYKHLAPCIFYDTDRITKEILGYKIRFRQGDGVLYHEQFTSEKITMEEKYKSAIDKLTELIDEKTKYEELNKVTEEVNEEAEPDLKLDHHKKLPQYISPKKVNNITIGYYVTKYLDNNSNPYPDAEFSQFTKQANLEAAKRHIESLRIKNENELFREYIPENIKAWAEEEKKKNPRIRDRDDKFKHLAHNIIYSTDRYTKENIGYYLKFKKADGTIHKQYWSCPKMTMEEKYESAIQKLTELINEKNHI